MSQHLFKVASIDLWALLYMIQQLVDNADHPLDSSVSP